MRLNQRRGECDIDLFQITLKTTVIGHSWKKVKTDSPEYVTGVYSAICRLLAQQYQTVGGITTLVAVNVQITTNIVQSSDMKMKQSV